VIKFVSDLRQVGGFLFGPPISSTNKTDRHDINEILLKVALSTSNKQTNVLPVDEICNNKTQVTNMLISDIWKT
jgi:hypothetical protein